MKRATEVVRAGHWPAGERVDTVTLLFDDRYRRRLRMLGDGGLDFLLDLVEPIVLHSGDGLRLDEGGYVEVKAALEDLVEELVGDALVQDETAAGDTRLPLVVEDRERRAVDRRREVGVVEHDVGALAAQLELHTLEVA